MIGTVKFFDARTMYGFLLSDADGREYFTHRSDLTAARRLLAGERVEFDIEEAERGPRARNVRRLDPPNPVTAECSHCRARLAAFVFPSALLVDPHTCIPARA